MFRKQILIVSSLILFLLCLGGCSTAAYTGPLETPFGFGMDSGFTMPETTRNRGN